MEEPNILVKTALNDAVQYVNRGTHPTEALSKVAEELDLNPNYIHRVGEALNVALHYKHFKSASDRSAEFEIADIPKVVENVFSFSEKTAAEYVSETFSGSDTNTEIFNYNRMLSNPLYKKAFLEISSAKETEEYFPTTLNKVYEKSANYISNLQQEADELEMQKVAAELDLNAKFSSLADHFKKDAAYRTAFEEFESQVFSKHGEQAVPYLDLIYKTAKIAEERGVHDSNYVMFDPCKEFCMFDSMMKSAQDMILLEKKSLEAQENISFESSYLTECKKLLGKTAKTAKEEPIVRESPEQKKHDEEEASESESSEKKETSQHEMLEKQEEKETSEENEKEESAVHEKAEKEKGHEEEDENEDEDPVLARIKKKIETSPEENKLEDPVKDRVIEKEAFLSHLMGFSSLAKTLNTFHNPAEKSFTGYIEKSILGDSRPVASKPNLTLENMERKLLLQELILTDPILSKVNPAKVARAFEQLLRLSPEISKEKEVVRAELRAMVSSQALSKYDADLMTKLDTSMLKRRVATQEFNKGNSQIFKI